MKVVKIIEDLVVCIVVILLLFLEESSEARRHDRWEKISGRLCYTLGDINIIASDKFFFIIQNTDNLLS